MTDQQEEPRVLERLRHFGEMTASSLGRDLWGRGVTRALTWAMAAGMLLKRLEDRGWVQHRYTDDNHCLYSLTEMGYRALDEIEGVKSY
jgi:DNA-binding MarR family transcriptional regulator